MNQKKNFFPDQSLFSVLTLPTLFIICIAFASISFAEDIGLNSEMPYRSQHLNPLYTPFLWAPVINSNIPDNGNISIIISSDLEDGSTQFYHIQGRLQKTPLGHFAVWQEEDTLIKSTKPPMPAAEWKEPEEFYVPETLPEIGEPSNPSDITNLVFSGGGIKGLAYAGALEVLQELDILKNITRIAGASAGAITAGLLAVGYTPEEIMTELKKQNFADFLDSYDNHVDLPKILREIKNGTFDVKKNILNLMLIITDIGSEYGICEGTAFKNWLVERFREKGFDQTTTFRQLYDSRQIDLNIVICNANYSKTEIANPISHPDTTIIEAIKSSMSIPFVYSPYKISGNLYVDGGTMYGYPVDLFDDISLKEATLGFILYSRDSIFRPERKTISNVFDLLQSVVSSIFRVSQESIFRSDNARRSVFIDCGDIGPLDFDLNDEQKAFLVQKGREATQQYFRQ